MFRYGRSEEDAMEKLMFDIYYIKNWSLWLEIEIGIRTISVMLRKKGI
jgi:lipopolysaccharide/colanic/teichoic acid biosynthesis glycosyltransferase